MNVDVCIMNELVKKLQKRKFPVLFTSNDLQKLKFENDILKKYLKEALENNWIENIYNDIYILTNEYKKRVCDGNVLAQMIYPDSYLSGSRVLCDYNWILDGIYAYTSVLKKDSNNDDIKVVTKNYGKFIYYKLYDNISYAGIIKNNYGLGNFYIAKPLRALCDLVYELNYEYENIYFFKEDFRIGINKLESLKKRDFNELQGKFNIPLIENFLNDLRKELRL